MRPRNPIILLIALGLWLAPSTARSADPEEEGEATSVPSSDSDGEDDESAEDGETQAQPPRPMLDPTQSRTLGRGVTVDPSLTADRGKKRHGSSKAKEAEPAEDEGDGEDGEDDPAEKGLAGQDDEVAGGGDGHWSTSASVDRRELERAPRDTPVNIDFVETDIKDVVKYFAEITGRNFILAEKLNGKITIISPTPVTIAEAYEAFLSALDAAGFTTVTEGKITRIVPNKQSIREPIRLYPDEYLPYTANMVTRIIKLENISADDITKIASKMVGDGGDVTAYTPTNALIITDSANNIRRIEELLTELDVSAPTQSMEVIQIEWADATDVVEKIKTVFGVDEASTGGTSAPAAQTPAERRRSKRNRDRDKATPSTAAASSSSDQIGSESYIGKILADERTNSIIIMATDTGLEDVKEFIARIDYEIDPWAKSDIHVIYLEHANAEDLAQVLSNLTQETNQRAQQNQRGSTRTGGTARGGAKKGGDSPAGGSGGGSVAQFEGGVKVTADASTNSLVITASRDDFYRLRRVIEMLDIRRKQVFVEAVIMEISDNNERDTGIGFHTGYEQENVGGTDLGMGAIGSVGGGSLMSALAGDAGMAMDLSGVALGVFGSSIPVPFGSGILEIPAFGIVLTALESDLNTEVLSAPNLMTLDNEEAEFVVGQTIPFSAGFTTTTQGMPIANFSREDVALTLRLTPQINESDTVTLEIFLEITEVVPETQGSDLLSTGGVTTTKRSAETMVSVINNQTVVLGGLMQTTQTLSEDKVPVLGDIPLFGALFRSKKKTDKKVNLLVFLTPHVIDGPEDMQEIYTVKMLQRQEFMRRFYGKSLEEKQANMNELLMYSMNLPDTPPVYRERQSAPRHDSMDMDPFEGPPGPGGHSEPIFRPSVGGDEEEVVVEDEGDEGYDEGYDDAYEDAYDDAYDEAYDEGYDDAEDDRSEDDDDEEDEETGEESAEDAGDGGAAETVIPGPGEILITPGGGEIRVGDITAADLEQLATEGGQ